MMNSANSNNHHQKHRLAWLRWAAPLAVFLLLLLLFWRGLSLDSSTLPSPLVGQPMPAFSLEMLHDASVLKTEQDFKGQVALINVWATWCFACHHEHPMLMDLAYLNRVPIYGLNYRDDREAALSWLEALGDPYQFTVFDPDATVSIDWGVYGAPETFVIDQKGIIHYRHVGVITINDWETVFLPLIEQLEQAA